MRTMYDSTTAADLPADGDLYLAYVDGRYANVDAVSKRFPHKKIVRCTVLGSLNADVADVEQGDMKPESGAFWAKAKLARGEHPTLYFIQSQEPAILAALKAAGVDPAKVNLFAANYDGKAVVPAGYVAKQYADPAKHGKGHFDVSAVAPYWPGVDPKPAPPKSWPLAVTTRAAVALLTSRMNHRRRPVNLAGRRVLTACRAAIDHALAIK